MELADKNGYTAAEPLTSEANDAAAGHIFITDI